jgi:energy-coupling factor transporter ATP-binding protein EcfA2
MRNAPYPGLRPFRRDEADIFFGRDEQLDQLLEKLGKSRFLAIVGPSGCGKSSLIQAGLVHSLEAGFLASAGVSWWIATLRPGTHPMGNLARVLLAQMALYPEQETESDRVAFLLATLYRGPLGLVEVLQETPPPAGTNLLLLIDQFEEIFPYREHHRDEAEAFVALLMASAAQRLLPIYVVITVRSDFLGGCILFDGLPEVLNASQFLLPQLSREQRRASIEGPARVFGGIVEPALVNRLLDEEEADTDQLALLQHTLMRLWTLARQRSESVLLSLADYESSGGLKEVLSRHAEEAFAELDTQQQGIAMALFRYLSDPLGTHRATSRPVAVEQIARAAAVTTEQVTAVIEVFRRPDHGFLTPPADVPLTSETRIELSYAGLIRQWQRLSAWVEEEAVAAETYRRLVAAAQQWQQGKTALWATPDLEQALAWRKHQQPTAAWAEGYGSHFELAMAFLDASQQQQQGERRQLEGVHQAVLRRMRRQFILALIAMLIAVCLAVWALWEHVQVDRESVYSQQVKSQD